MFWLLPTGRALNRTTIQLWIIKEIQRVQLKTNLLFSGRGVSSFVIACLLMMMEVCTKFEDITPEYNGVLRDQL